MNVRALYRTLFKEYGPQGWWPIFVDGELTYGMPRDILATYRTRGRDPYFEIAVGAILTQNTAWNSAVKAVHNLFMASALTPQAVSSMETACLESMIRAAGYYRQKTRTLQELAGWLLEEYQGDLTQLGKESDMHATRSLLLERWGIGDETADSILLYALGQPVFVVDAYTRRLCKTYGIEYASYAEYQNYFMTGCGGTGSTALYQEFHALIVAWGKMH